jgi:hypothetical protein
MKSCFIEDTGSTRTLVVHNVQMAIPRRWDIRSRSLRPAGHRQATGQDRPAARLPRNLSWTGYQRHQVLVLPVRNRMLRTTCSGRCPRSRQPAQRVDRAGIEDAVGMFRFSRVRLTGLSIIRLGPKSQTLRDVFQHLPTLSPIRLSSAVITQSRHRANRAVGLARRADFAPQADDIQVRGVISFGR